MMEPDYRKASHAARKALRENHVVRPPVLPREIARSYGLDVVLVELPEHRQEVAGFLDFSENKIFVNGADPYNRQTFTIAHELGHFLLHKSLFEQQPEQYQVLLRRPIHSVTDPLEKEANAFAADLLVPMDMLNLYKRYATDDDLADIFSVSNEVIGYRLKFATKIYA